MEITVKFFVELGKLFEFLAEFCKHFAQSQSTFELMGLLRSVGEAGADLINGIGQFFSNLF